MSDAFTILNYQGSKKNLIEFIHKNTNGYINDKKAILDIFSGTCAVGYSFKRSNTVYANDSEFYSYIISKALLGESPQKSKEKLSVEINKQLNINLNKLLDKYCNYYEKEQEALSDSNLYKLDIIYNSMPTIWNNKDMQTSEHNLNELFTTYYSTSYFGIYQAMEIDSIRYAIEMIKEEHTKYILFSCLFYSMKECVFSKDGHMAQPLDRNKNANKLLKTRRKSITESFYKKLEEFYLDSFVLQNGNNKVFNKDFIDLLKDNQIIDEVGFIYADPPYTDMQYSRYYHLLNVVSKYNYPLPTINRNGYTKGMYTVDRFQSDLSKKQTSLAVFNNLICFSKKYKKNLAISFAYPADVINQKTNRYVMSIDQIINTAEMAFGKSSVDIVSKDYTHSNNRNSKAKKVIEYLVLCKY